MGPTGGICGRQLLRRRPLRGAPGEVGSARFAYLATCLRASDTTRSPAATPTCTALSTRARDGLDLRRDEVLASPRPRARRPGGCGGRRARGRGGGRAARGRSARGPSWPRARPCCAPWCRGARTGWICFSAASREVSGAPKVSAQSSTKPTRRSRASRVAPSQTSVTRSAVARPCSTVACAARVWAWAASRVSRWAEVRAPRAVVVLRWALAAAGRPAVARLRAWRRTSSRRPACGPTQPACAPERPLPDLAEGVKVGLAGVSAMVGWMPSSVVPGDWSSRRTPVCKPGR